MAKEMALKDPDHPELGWKLIETGDTGGQVPASRCGTETRSSWIRRKSIFLLGLGISAVSAWRAILYYRINDK